MTSRPREGQAKESHIEFLTSSSGAIEDMEGGFSTLRAELKGDIQKLRADMNSQNHQLIFWLVGTAIASCTLLVTIAKFFLSAPIAP